MRQEATVKELKNAIKRYTILNDTRNNSGRDSDGDSDGDSNTNTNGLVLNWKYVWKRYCLVYNNETSLNDDSKLLKDYGIFNKCELKFSKKLFSK